MIRDCECLHGKISEQKRGKSDNTTLHKMFPDVKEGLGRSAILNAASHAPAWAAMLQRLLGDVPVLGALVSGPPVGIGILSAGIIEGSLAQRFGRRCRRC